MWYKTRYDVVVENTPVFDCLSSFSRELTLRDRISTQKKKPKLLASGQEVPPVELLRWNVWALSFTPE